MATGTKAYLEDHDGNNILPATDWSMVQNKPGNLATTGQLPTLGPWQRDGIVYKNGAYDWDHVNNGWNCAYRIADMGSFKTVELRLVFGINHDVTAGVEVIDLPNVIQPDGNIEHTELTNGGWTSSVGVVTFRNNAIFVGGLGGQKVPANTELSLHITYFTTI